jgi:phosphoribosyl 1,2-cyclic phosphodiesterase
MRVWSLASGSSGNCFLVESEGTRIMVECGRPMRDIRRYLDHCGVSPWDLDGLLITHAHGDHVKSAREMSDAFQLPVYASEGTLGCSSLRDAPLGHAIKADEPFSIGEIEVRPFAVPHDCREPLAFRLESQSAKAAIITDLGWTPDSVKANLGDLDLLVMEANYDPYLLHAGRYPAFLKARVSGYRGHLANEDMADAVAECGDHAPSDLWLAHISENNNTPDQALSAVGNLLRRRGLGHVRVQATRHRRPSLHWDSANQERQLALL